MKLLDAADVNPTDRWSRRWIGGYEGVARECAVHMELQDPCATTQGAISTQLIIGDITSRKSNYHVQPFPVVSALRQSVSCEQDDDKDWFRRAVQAKMEYAISRALVVNPVTGNETWVGDAGVQSVALAGTSAAQLRTAVAAAYDKWNSTVVDPEGVPIMHVPPVLLGDLQAAGIIMVTGPDEVSSGYARKVVVAPGYDTATPHIFFTGHIKIRIAGIDEQGGVLYDHRINNYTLTVDQFAAIDVAPCSIVRVGS